MATNLEILNRVSAEKGVGTAVRDFATRTMGAESGGDANAKNSESSACGLFQFIDSTWLQMIKQKGAQNGYGEYASHIHKGSDGKYYVDSAEMREKIMRLKRDPEASCRMGIEFTNMNARALEAKGHEVTTGNLYLAHFLGDGGANKILSADPGTPISSLLDGGVMHANRGIKFRYTDRNGEKHEKSFAQLTAGDLRSWAAKKMGGKIRYDLLDREVQSGIDRWEGERADTGNVFEALGELSFGDVLAALCVALFAGIADAIKKPEGSAAKPTEANQNTVQQPSVPKMASAPVSTRTPARA